MNLANLIKEKALMRGDFTLANGGKSDHYFDLSKVTMTPMGLWLATHALIDKFDGRWDRINAIGGPASGAIPLVSGVLMHLVDSGYYLQRGFYYRNTPKNYGVKNPLIEGDVREGDRAVLIEDVTNSGTSLLKCALEVRNMGCDIIEIISIVDREEGAKELFNKNDLPFSYVFNKSSLLT